MKEKLVNAIDWRENKKGWYCNLKYQNNGFNRIHLKPGSDISFKVLKGRFCIGFTDLAVTNDAKAGSWKKYYHCPYGAEINRGMRCRICSAVDVALPCLRCNGDKCQARQEIRRACENRVAHVYLASFGDGMIKVGVSQENRVMTRWIEQGADAAMRVLTGNGIEARRFERRIQQELGALNFVKTSQKTNVLRSDPELMESTARINRFGERVHRIFPDSHHFHEKPHILHPYYRLPKINKRPRIIKIRDGGEVSGKISGVKGPTLLLEANHLPYTINLKRLIGKKIDTENISSIKAQTGIDSFI